MIRVHSQIAVHRMIVRMALAGAIVLATPRPSARADAECPERYTVTPDTIKDNDTQLTWQQAVDPASFTWSEAKQHCLNLGWRLPTVLELSTIVDVGRLDPAIDPVFVQTPSTFFWSSSPYAGGSGYAWYVDFYVGNVYNGAVGDDARVRCVR